MTKQTASTEQDKKRALVLRDVHAQRLTVAEAARSLGLSERQVWRLLAAYREDGKQALQHGNRGRIPSNAVAPAVRAAIVTLAQTTYQGFNQTHLMEKLLTEHNIALSQPTLWRILRQAGIKSTQRHRRPKHRSRRTPRPRAGMLLQLDGSDHDWLEGRGPRLTLLGAIDDATGFVPAGLFRMEEDAQGYMLLFRHIVLTCGIPLAVYADGHSIFVPPISQRETVEEQLAGRREPTQVGRMLEELTVELITALSPQAKGRIERLWGTFQDRLVSELRLAGATTLAEAQQVLDTFLPAYNQRFSHAAAETESAYRPVPTHLDLECIFAFQYERTVANDNTVHLGQAVVQIPENRQRRSYAKARVRLYVSLNGGILVYHNGQRIAEQPRLDEDIVLRTLKRRH